MGSRKMKKPVSREAQTIAFAVVAFILILIGMTIVGIWIKLFWMGWVMA